MTAHRIAVVGIDGSGKSTVIRRLLQVLPSEELGIIHCPTYHENADAPLGALSRIMEAFSRSADELGSFELKAAALYMQMTLFGPVARALDDAFAPRFLVCERHPVVDTLAYGPFYQRMVNKPVLEADLVRLEQELERRVPGAYRVVRAWHASETRRLGTNTSFRDLAGEVSGQFSRPTGELIAEFSSRYRTSLPDAVVLLDVDADEAQRRISRRGDGGAELHETATYLAALRQSYHAALDGLSKIRPDVKVYRISTGDGQSVDACVEELIAGSDLTIGRTQAPTL